MANADAARNGKFLSHEISSRQVTELIGVARGLIADAELRDCEIEFLYKWLAANDAAHANPVIGILMERIRDIFSDGYVDEQERTDLASVLEALTANDFEIGEVLKSSDLPLTSPAPNIEFANRVFCFTGTFTYGPRRACEALVARLGGECSKTLTQQTDYLIVGSYATASWHQSSFGRKIEHAVQLRGKGAPVAIVAERHWLEFF